MVDMEKVYKIFLGMIIFVAIAVIFIGHISQNINYLPFGIPLDFISMLLIIFSFLLLTFLIIFQI